jgi:hypothetical protein
MDGNKLQALAEKAAHFQLGDPETGSPNYN